MGRARHDVIWAHSTDQEAPRVRSRRRFVVPRSLTLGMLALLLSLATPVGLFVLWMGLAHDVESISILKLTLGYVTFSTAAVFCVFGFFVGRLVDQLVAARERLALDAREDVLTGLANRREFNRRLELEIRRRERSNEPLSLIMLDVDHFKSVNDTHGHRAGDAVLREVAARIKSCCRAVDLPARFGGEEFAVIAPGLAEDAAAQVAERIRKQVEEAVTAFAEKNLQVTISAGVATHDDEVRDADALIEEADAELLRAKRAGRNTVCRTRR